MQTQNQEQTEQEHSNPNQLGERELFWTAVMFYTRLRVPTNITYSTQALNKSRKYFPLIGILIGAIGVITFLVCQLFLSNIISIALSMVATILATGAFHEDGFADSCDGLIGGWEAKEMLKIMKDSRIGSYATIGLICLLGIKFLSLVELSQASFNILVFSYIAAHTVSRLASSLVIERYAYVQDIDQSKVKPITDAGLSSPDLHQTLIISAVPIIILAFVAFIPTLLSLLACFVVAKLFANYSEKRIGGYTGDILGAIQQLSEVTFYLAFLALI